jgi:hypothetical protein
MTRIAFGAAVISLALIGTCWAITFKKERRVLRIVTAARQHCLLVLRWSDAIPQNPEIALLSPYPIPEVVGTIRTLAENDAFRPRLVSQKLASAVNKRPDADAASAGNLDAAGLEPTGQLTFQGWARIPGQDRPADCVVLGFETPDGGWKPFCVVETGGNRPNVAPHLGHAALDRSGFSGRIDTANLPHGDVTLKALAVDLQNERAFPIANAISLALQR